MVTNFKRVNTAISFFKVVKFCSELSVYTKIKYTKQKYEDKQIALNELIIVKFTRGLHKVQ